MKTFVNILFFISMTLLMSGCFAEKTYIGKVDVIGIGAGQKSATGDAHSIEKKQLSNITVAYASDIQITEQKVNKTVKYVAGDALSKSYSGTPTLLVDYLNSYQSLSNKVLILDKNGVVAWSGNFKSRDIQSANGVFDYGFTGPDRMTFGEAMEKYVLDEETADYDDEKKIVFPKGNTEHFTSAFSYSSKYPFLLAKFPDMSLVDSNGKAVSVSALATNGKPTVLVFYMSKAPSTDTLANDVNKAASIAGMFSGNIGSDAPLYPHNILQSIQTIYFK